MLYCYCQHLCCIGHPPTSAYPWSFIWWFICVLLTSINCGVFLALNDSFKEIVSHDSRGELKIIQTWIHLLLTLRIVTGHPHGGSNQDGSWLVFLKKSEKLTSKPRFKDLFTPTVRGRVNVNTCADAWKSVWTWLCAGCNSYRVWCKKFKTAPHCCQWPSCCPEQDNRDLNCWK